MRTSAKVYALDTNVILRFLTRDDPILYAKAEEIMKAVAEGRLTVSCDPIVLAEVVWVLKSAYKQSKQAIVAALEPIVKSDNVLMPEKSRYALALNIFANTNAHFGDACVCAAALMDCDGRLISFDRKLTGISGIERTEIPE